MTEQSLKTEVDDSDDVVIIGDVMPKPMIAQGEDRRQRHVEFRKAKYKSDSIRITQKLKVKKRRRHVKKNARVKTTSKNGDLLKDEANNDNFMRFIPVCSRHTCMANRWRYEKNGRMRIEKSRTTKASREFPRDLERMLSPISPSPLDQDISLDDISIESSRLEARESKLESLIKRTRHRQKMLKMRSLCTPPPTNTPNENITEDKQEPDTDFKPPTTSTPIYEENDDNHSISSTSNITKQAKSFNTVSLEDIQLLFSPIEKSEEYTFVTTLNCQSNIESINMHVSKNNVESQNGCTNSIPKELKIQLELPKDTITSHKNYQPTITENKVQILKPNLKELQSNDHLQLVTSNNIYDHFSTNTNINNNNKELNEIQVHSIGDNNIQPKISENIQYVSSSNNIAHGPLHVSYSNVSQLNTQQDLYYKRPGKNECNGSILSYSPNQNKTSEMLILNMNKSQSKNDHDPFVNHPQNLKTEYIQTIVTHTRDCNNDNMMYISNCNKKDELNAANDMFLNNQQNQNIANIQTEGAHLNYEQNMENQENVTSNQHFEKQTQHFYPIHTNCTQTMDHNQTHITNTKQDLPNFPQNLVPNSNKDQIVNVRNMSLSYNNQNLPEQRNSSVCNDNMDNKSEPMNTTNLEDMEISMSCGSTLSENTLGQYSKPEYEHAADTNTYYENNNSLQQPISSLSSFIDDTHFPKECENIHASDSHKKYKQNIEDEMSISYDNNLPEPTHSHRNTLFENTEFEYYRHRSVSKSYNEQNNNITEQDDKNLNLFFENTLYNKSDDMFTTNKHFDTSRNSYGDEERQNRTKNSNFDNFYSWQQNKYTANSNHNYGQNNSSEQANRNNTAFYNDTHIKHHKSIYTHTTRTYKKREFYNDNGIDQESSSFSRHFYIKSRKTDYSHTAYSFKNHERNVDDKMCYNFKEEPKSQCSFFDDIHMKNKQRNCVYTDDSKKNYEHNMDDRNIPFNSNNFKQRSNRSQSSAPRHFYGNIRRETNNTRTENSSSYYETKMEHRKMTSNKNNLKEKKYKSSSKTILDKHEQRRTSVVTRKKENIFVDKRMSDEAYEDILIGLPCGRDTEDLA